MTDYIRQAFGSTHKSEFSVCLIKIILTALMLSATFLYGRNTVSVSGTVRNSENLEAVAFVSCFIEELQQGVTANERGYFVIPRINPGNYHLIVQMIGYRTKRIPVALDNSLSLSIELEPVRVELEGIQVRGARQRDDKDEFHIPLSELKISPARITELPQIAEPDLFRAIQMMPGVTSVSDYSAGLYVRGGSPDQNQILLDGIDVYNPSHLLGFFSTFNVDAINTVELIKGGFEAKYGGRLSSVMNVYNLDGNRNRFDGNINLSLITSKATFSGPWEKGSWMISGRRTYLELLDSMIEDDIPDYFFYDGHIKLNYDLSTSDFIQYSFYTGKDRFRLDEGLDLDLSWGNITNVVKWVHLFSPTFYSDVLLAHSYYGSTIDIELSDFSLLRKNRLYDISFKTDFSYIPSLEHNIEFGGEVKNYRVVFKVEQSDEQYEVQLPDVDETSIYSAAYLMDSWRPYPFTLFKYGLRLEHYSEGNYFRLSPRLSAKYDFTDNISGYAAWGKYYQYLTLLYLPENSFFDLWFPIDESVKPLEADHYIVGSDIKIGGNFSLNIEAYYKEMRNLTEYRPEIDFTYDPEGDLEQLYYIGTGDAYGIDVILNKDWLGLEGFISYSYGRTRRQFEELNDGLKYHPKFDRRHQFTVNENYRLRNWIFGVSYTYGTGQPMRRPLGIIEGRSIDGYPENIVLYGRPDSYRMPGYSRLDLSVRRMFYTRKYLIEPYVQIVNALSADNPNTVFYYKDGDDFKKTTSNNLPLIPSLGVNVKW